MVHLDVNVIDLRMRIIAERLSARHPNCGIASFPGRLPPPRKLNAGVEKRREKAWSIFARDTQEAHDFCDVI